jgi:hypothetical protein
VIWIFRNGQLYCDDDRRIFVAMTKPQRCNKAKEKHKLPHKHKHKGRRGTEYGGRKMKTLNEQIKNTTVGTDPISLRHRNIIDTEVRTIPLTHIKYMSPLYFLAW